MLDNVGLLSMIFSYCGIITMLKKLLNGLLFKLELILPIFHTTMLDNIVIKLGMLGLLLLLLLQA